MIGIYVIAAFLLIIIGGIKVNSQLDAFSYGYSSRLGVHFPIFSSMIMVLIGIAACSAVSAALHLGMVLAFKGKTSFGAMLMIVGLSALMKAVTWILAGICLLAGWWIPTLLFLGLGYFWATMWNNLGFHHAVEMEADKEFYAYFTAKILTMIAIILVIFILSLIFATSFAVMADVFDIF
jgi:hypothetical protein